MIGVVKSSNQASSISKAMHTIFDVLREAWGAQSVWSLYSREHARTKFVRARIQGVTAHLLSPSGHDLVGERSSLAADGRCPRRFCALLRLLRVLPDRPTCRLRDRVGNEMGSNLLPPHSRFQKGVVRILMAIQKLPKRGVRLRVS